jgi:uncharacterized protein (DUF1501 family)
MSVSLIHRRDFLGLTVTGFSAAITYPLFLGKTAAAVARKADPEDDRILVVIQLSGGNDGLSTVVPYSDSAYGKARNSTRISEQDVLKLDGRIGLHPNLKELRELYDDGLMAIVQGASYPNPTRSHFESMDVWHSADPRGRESTGWLGRAVDSACNNRRTPLYSVSLGNETPLALLGDVNQPITLRAADAYRRSRGKSHRDLLQALQADTARTSSSPYGKGTLNQLDFLRRVRGDAERSASAVRQALQGYRPAVEFPRRGNRLANDLRNISAMIARGLPARIYYASIGGFDTHANQRGRHDNLMNVFSAAVAAFLKDLKAKNLLHRTLVLTFSEFGRRVRENASRGTDHGVAAPVFLFGGRIRGGLHGQHPSLTELVNGDLAMTVDFRQVYASILDDWLGTPSKAILGSSYEKLPLVTRGRTRAF